MEPIVPESSVAVVLPAYNAARTLRATYGAIAAGLRTDVILVDDCSTDDTVALARELGIAHVVLHPSNRGYGANQKTCYREALARGAQYVVMLHPDSQYEAALIPAFVEFMRSGVCDVLLGNRVRSRIDALEGGMPRYKYVANRALTSLANCCLGTNLGDFHTGFRVYSRKVLEAVDWHENDDDFAFDPQFIAKTVALGFRVADAPMPCMYPPEASSIGFWASVAYGFQVLGVLFKYLTGGYARKPEHTGTRKSSSAVN
jgi:glycosyltransferase involved in cell wall biosynthesis